MTFLSYKAVVPANIAFLKYWGKRDAQSQWPANNSLSMSLANSVTTTYARVAPELRDHQVYFSGDYYDRTSSFAAKAYKHLDFLSSQLAYKSFLKIETSNSFPTGCGIASSASGFGALSLAALGAWLQADSLESLEKMGYTRSRIASLARQGSGSACRSFWGGYVSWMSGERSEQQELRSLFAAEHWQLADTIAIFSKHEKQVSSSKAHLDAWSSPLFTPRLAGIHEKEEQMIAALHAKDLRSLGPLLEQEALEMHGVMMTADPATCYLNSKSTHFLAWLRQLRKSNGIAAYFTIDAGPNIHVICEQSQQPLLQEQIKRSFPQLELLMDHVGAGPVLSQAGK